MTILLFLLLVFTVDKIEESCRHCTLSLPIAPRLSLFQTEKYATYQRSTWLIVAFWLLKLCFLILIFKVVLLFIASFYHRMRFLDPAVLCLASTSINTDTPIKGNCKNLYFPRPAGISLLNFAAHHQSDRSIRTR